MKKLVLVFGLLVSLSSSVCFAQCTSCNEQATRCPFYSYVTEGNGEKVYLDKLQGCYVWRMRSNGSIVPSGSTITQRLPLQAHINALEERLSKGSKKGRLGLNPEGYTTGDRLKDGRFVVVTDNQISFLDTEQYLAYQKETSQQRLVSNK